MYPLYLFQNLQLNVTIVPDNAKTHKKKSVGRRQQFARSQSEPVIRSPDRAVVTTKSSKGKGGLSNSKNGQSKQRPGMCRWNSFTQRSSKSLSLLAQHDDDTSLACNLKTNAPKPVRRGSWGQLAINKPSSKPSFDSNVGHMRPPEPVQP